MKSLLPLRAAVGFRLPAAAFFKPLLVGFLPRRLAGVLVAGAGLLLFSGCLLGCLRLEHVIKFEEPKWLTQPQPGVVVRSVTTQPVQPSPHSPSGDPRINDFLHLIGALP